MFATLLNMLSDHETVTFYPTYGYRDGQAHGWRIPMRLRVTEDRPIVEGLVDRLAGPLGQLSDGERRRLVQRLKPFIDDSESRETVQFVFDQDPKREVFSLGKQESAKTLTNLNGVAEGSIYLPVERAEELLRAQNSQTGWLTFRAVSAEHTGTGRLRLVEPTGTSLIVDVDDTIKITEILAGAEAVLANTFVREYRPTAHVPERLKRFPQASVHYVTGSPWQLCEPLRQFVADQKLPEGTWHMKSIHKNLLSLNTWRELADVMLSDDATRRQKQQQIETIIQAFPKREFILVGDSGEADPEIYRDVRANFPQQIKAIWIRDSGNLAGSPTERLANMERIPAD